MIYLLGVLYFIIGIFVASFYATYRENKTGKPITEDYGTILSVILMGVFWIFYLLLIPVYIVVYLVSLIAKFASYCAREILNPRNNV